MLSYKNYGHGVPFAQVVDGKDKSKIMFINCDSTNGSNELKIKDNGHLVPIPTVEERDVVYICGASGSGKSTYAAQYIYNYLNLFPNNPVYVFSRLEIDPILDLLGCEAIPINENLEKLDVIKDLSNALCLFDDIDTIPDKKLRDKVYAISMDILETGRHKNIYILITSHLINGNDRKVCRTNINEAKKIVLFPKGGNAYGIRYLLKNYIGLSKNQIDEILKLNTRWVTISKNYPQFYFYEKGAKMI